MSTTEHLSIFLVVSLILLSSCTFFNPILQTKADSWIWRDEFTDQNSRWKWAYSAGTGYHLLTTVDGYSVAENGITAASTQYAYSDCALCHLPGRISQSQLVTIEIRAKFSHSMLQGAAKGSQGLIIWNDMSNFAGFLDFSVETQGFEGLRAGVVSNGTIYANEYLGDTYDARNWHIYRIVLKSDGTALYVDGNLVAQTIQRPYSPAELNLWVDNAAYTLSGSRTNLDLKEDQKLYVDYVAWSDAGTSIPTGSIIINDGDAYTTSTAVTLSLTYTDASSGVSQVRYNNDGVWDTEEWEAPTATRAWTLTSGDGTKTVYYQIKNNVGITSVTYRDTITLSTSPPTQPSDSVSTTPPIDSTKPTANAGSDQKVNEDAMVTLDGSASSDNFGIERYSWAFTDETDKTLTGKIASYTFSTPGVYTITLKVEDAAGNAAIDVVVVTVLDVTDPMADAGQNQTVNVGASVSFDAGASSDNVGVHSYSWDFGDGITRMSKTTTHKYIKAGTYNVTLTVKDQADNLATDTIVVIVSEAGDFPLWLIGSVVAVIAIVAVVATLLLWKRQKTTSSGQTSVHPIRASD